MPGKPARRRRLAPQHRRQQLLEAGLELLGHRPLEELSVQEVAGHAEVAPGLLYRYFPDKRAFREALLVELGARLSAATRWPAGGFAAALRASLEARIGFGECQPGLWRALHGAGSPVLQRLRDEQVERVLRGAGVSQVPPRAAIQLRGWSGFCEAAITAWLERREPERDELVALLATALDPALAAPARQPRHGRGKPRVRLVGAFRPTP